MTQKTSKKTENGFTLVEIAIVMIISGLILAAFVSSYLRWKDILRTTQTRENIEIIADAISTYVSLNYRIPCPAMPINGGADPFGTEIGSGADGDIGTCNNPVEWEGILPFATLGLNASAAKDGWGNYYTYQVSPVFTDNLDRRNIDIHAKCRTTDWIEGAILDTSASPPTLNGGRNLNHRKANFCCIEPDDDEINIYSNLPPLPALPSPSIIYDKDDDAWYEAADEVADPNHNDAANPIAGNGAQPYYDNSRYGGGILVAGNAVSGHTDMVVYAIISHGKNGAGAFILGGNRTAPPQGTAEIVNATTNDGPANANGPDGFEDQAIYDLPHNDTNGDDFYDDIVHWQTQSNIMARLKRESCALP